MSSNFISQVDNNGYQRLSRKNILNNNKYPIWGIYLSLQIVWLVIKVSFNASDDSRHRFH